MVRRVKHTGNRVVGQIVPANPASPVRGRDAPLLDAIDVGNPVGLRDRAIIALLTYTFARVGAAVTMRIEDVVQGRRTWVPLHEKGGKRLKMPCQTRSSGYSLEPFLYFGPRVCSSASRMNLWYGMPRALARLFNARIIDSGIRMFSRASFFSNSNLTGLN